MLKRSSLHTMQCVTFKSGTHFSLFGGVVGSPVSSLIAGVATAPGRGSTLPPTDGAVDVTDILR